MSTVIKVENLSKQYRLGQVGTGTIRDDFKRWWSSVRGKEDPFLKIGSVNDRTVKGEDGDYVWALRDMNFQVNQGEVLGIIGKNGAGKSTLLKILSKVTQPTTGSIKIKGRIASLLEVGTGFHPELSGRENVFQNGAILGMTKKEIKSKFDEIVDFSGVERYIDTPVKRYSSGMYVRLAFAVAAHLEPEILIVDEVLAVGDAEFQRKCLGKMKDVSESDGRTILFVSHNIKAIKALCKKTMVLSNGTNIFEGDTNHGIDLYLSQDGVNWSEDGDIEKQLLKQDEKEVCRITEIKIMQNNILTNTVRNGDDFRIEIGYEVTKEIYQLRIFFDLIDEEQDLIIRSFHDEHAKELTSVKPGKYLSVAYFPKNMLVAKNHTLLVKAGIFNQRIICEFKIKLFVNATNDFNIVYATDPIRSKVQPYIEWKNQNSV